MKAIPLVFLLRIAAVIRRMQCCQICVNLLNWYSPSNSFCLGTIIEANH